MRFLVFQHLAVEHPGILRDYWREEGIEWDAIELDEGDQIPVEFSTYDALVVMGGPMDVWEEDLHPWLIVEKRAIRRWIDTTSRPLLGICLGHQLLADAMAARSSPRHDQRLRSQKPAKRSVAIRRTSSGRSPSRAIGICAACSQSGCCRSSATASMAHASLRAGRRASNRERA